MRRRRGSSSHSLIYSHSHLLSLPLSLSLSLFLSLSISGADEWKQWGGGDPFFLFKFTPSVSLSLVQISENDEEFSLSHLLTLLQISENYEVEEKGCLLNSNLLTPSLSLLQISEYDEEEEGQARGEWGNKLDFLFSCISVSVGKSIVYWYRHKQ